MAKEISKDQLAAYLNYVARRLGTVLPGPYASPAHYSALNTAELNIELQELYKAIGFSRIEGLATQTRFLQLNLSLPDLDEEDNPAVQTDVLRQHYRPVNPAIGRNNFKPYLHWLGEQAGKMLEDYSSDSGQPSDKAIRETLHRIYAKNGITADQAVSAENEFVKKYQQHSVKHALVRPSQPPQTMHQRPVLETAPDKIAPQYKHHSHKEEQPSSQPNQAAPKTSSSSFSQRKRPRSGKLVALLAAILFVAVGGAWLYGRYKVFNSLMYIYPLTDNIAVRDAASDVASAPGRMDMFGEYADGHGGGRISFTKFHLASENLENNYYRIMKKDDFFAWLFSSKGDCLYVNSFFVTTVESEYKEMKKFYENLQGDFNELDKLTLKTRLFIYRTIGLKASLSNIQPARSCVPQKLLSKTAPLSIFRYTDKITKELIVIIQATDGFCYHLRGPDDSTAGNIGKVMVSDGSALKAGGTFTIGSSLCTFRQCNNATAFIASFPFTEFKKIGL